MTHQEARGVVKEAPEADGEVPLEGRLVAVQRLLQGELGLVGGEMRIPHELPL